MLPSRKDQSNIKQGMSSAAQSEDTRIPIEIT